MADGAQAQTQIWGGGSTLAALVYGQQFTDYATSAFDPTVAFNYKADGSGAGQAGLLNNDPSVHGYVAGTTIGYGASDATLSSFQVSTWNNSEGAPGCTSTTTAKCTAAGKGVGLAQGGPLIQIPTFATPVTIAFKTTNQRANGNLQFTDDQLCGIFSGKITSWSDTKLSGIVTNGKGAPTGTIFVAYRSDGSGTTFLTTQHLAAVCTTGPSGNSNITFTANTSFASEFGGTPPSNFHGFSGSGGVQGGITGNNNSIGYLSPDYTLIAPINTGLGGFPPTATVKNATDGNFYLPTSANAQTALQSAPAPANPADPTQYVPAVAKPASGYPISGFTTWDFPQCYADNNTAFGVFGFTFNLLTNPALTNLLTQNGFSALPSQLLNAVTDHLLPAGGPGTGDPADSPPLDVQDPAVCQAAGASGAGTYAGR